MKTKSVIVSRILFLVYMAAVLYLCFANFSNLSGVPAKIWGIPTDKFIHFVMFLPFMILVYLSIGKHFSSPLACIGIILLLFAIGCGFAWLTELCQGWFTKNRVTDSADFKADSLALAAGAFIVFFTELFRRK